MFRDLILIYSFNRLTAAVQRMLASGRNADAVALTDRWQAWYNRQPTY